MKTLSKIIAISLFSLFSLPLLAHAAGKTASATMQVTFEVKESCTVQTTQAADKAAKAAPAVACQLNTPYQAQAAASAAVASGDSSAAAPRQQAADGVWTITF